MLGNRTFQSNPPNYENNLRARTLRVERISDIQIQKELRVMTQDFSKH